jgi:hypothetical protein
VEGPGLCALTLSVPGFGGGLAETWSVTFVE